MEIEAENDIGLEVEYFDSAVRNSAKVQQYRQKKVAVWLEL